MKQKQTKQKQMRKKMKKLLMRLLLLMRAEHPTRCRGGGRGIGIARAADTPT